jgi:D-glycero-alpha-D-manno-heptose-7-phosphate kinase
MIISRTPLRISFAGGGSDLEAFYQHEPGAVLTTAIDKYIYITVNRKFDNHIRASYSRTEIVASIDELQHELIRESLKQVGIDGGIEVTSISDIPSEGTGLGSSSTYTVGLLNALYAHTGRSAGAERLAREACDIEINRCCKPIGKQDQYIAAYGGLQFMQFNPDGTVFVDPVLCDPRTKRALHERLLMLYTGLTRSADAILEQQRRNTHADQERRDVLRCMTSLARELRECLIRNKLDSFGDALHQAWLLKTRLAAGITTGAIDDWYNRARAHGAIGGKILGAGGGGFLLLYAPPERHEQIRAALGELRCTPFSFEPQGSKIIYVEEGGQA